MIVTVKRTGGVGGTSQTRSVELNKLKANDKQTILNKLKELKQKPQAASPAERDRFQFTITLDGNETINTGDAQEARELFALLHTREPEPAGLAV